jgi:hypothetical protein
MTSLTSDMQSVLERLESLERQNRRLKQATAAAFIALSSLVLMAHCTGPDAQSHTLTMAQTTANTTLEANAFVLKDANGKIKGRLAMIEGFPKLCLYGSGESNIELSVNPRGGPHLVVMESERGIGSVAFLASDALKISDEKGFSSTLGVSRTVTTRTGEEHQTSAASLTLFNEKGNVIWQSP